MEQFEYYKSQLDKKLHEKNMITDVLAQAEEKTGVNRLYITLGKVPYTNVHQKSNFWSELDGGLILCGQDLYELIESEKNNFRPKTAHLEGIEIDALEFFG